MEDEEQELLALWGFTLLVTPIYITVNEVNHHYHKGAIHLDIHNN